ncbi:MAG: glycerol-3-phosphate 1-O-acyltransferase PlsY [Anaerorhabdus sp.]
MFDFNFILRGIIAVFGSYILGSIPWALVIGKVFYKTDVREHGSGNLGASNAGRTLGKKAGAIVTLLDALKAFIAVALCAIWFPDWAIVAGLACCFGHCFPIFANFKGGKAVASAMGYFLGLGVFVTHQILITFVAPVAVFFVVLYLCKMVSLSSLTAIAIEVLLSFFITKNTTVTLAIFILFLFIAYRHKDNIKRIIHGEERKITWM